MIGGALQDQGSRLPLIVADITIEPTFADGLPLFQRSSCAYQIKSMTYTGEGWTSDPSPPPLALAKVFSPSGCGQIFAVSSRIMRCRAFTANCGSMLTSKDVLARDALAIEDKVCAERGRWSLVAGWRDPGEDF